MRPPDPEHSTPRRAARPADAETHNSHHISDSNQLTVYRLDESSGLLHPLIHLIRRVERRQVFAVLKLADGFDRISQRFPLNQKELNDVLYRCAGVTSLNYLKRAISRASVAMLRFASNDVIGR